MRRLPILKGKKEVLIQFWYSYFWFGILSLCFILLLIFYSFSQLENTMERNTSRNMEMGLELLDQEISTLNQVVLELSSDQYFSRVRAISENIEYRDYYYILKLKEKLNDTTRFLSIAEKPMLYYPGRILFFSDVVFSKEAQDSTKKLYAQNYGKLEDMFAGLSTEKHSYDLLKADCFYDSLDGAYYGIPYVHVYSRSGKEENPLFAAIIPIHTLFELCRLEEIANIAEVTIFDKNTGDILFQQENKVMVTATEIVADSQKCELSISVCIPNSYYIKQLSGLIVLGVAYVLAFLVIAIIVSVSLAYKNAQKHIALDEEISHWMLREHILVGVYGKQLEELNDRYASHPTPFRMVIIRLDKAQWSVPAFEIKDVLRKCKIDYWFISRIKPNYYMMLIKSDLDKEKCSVDLETFKEAAENKFQCECILSVSSIQESLERIKEAYQLVQSNMRCFPEYKLLFQEDIDTIEGESLTKLNMLENLKLTDIILSGNEKMAVKLIRKQWEMAKTIHKDSVLKQLVTMQQAVLRSVADRLNDELEELNHIDEDNIAVLEDKMIHSAKRLCQTVTEKKIEDKTDNHKRIIEFIKENYSDCNFYMTTLVEEFGLSDRTISKIIKESVNMTFSEYVETLRLQKALRLLDESEYSIRQIIGMCGFSAENTFFNAFKRKFGITPNSYRNAKKQEEQKL